VLKLRARSSATADATPDAAAAGIATAPPPIPPRGGRNRASFLRTSAWTGVAAAVSVATGLLLDVSIATRFGAGRATDAFFVASRLPISVGTVLLGGSSSALVPIIGTWISRRGEAEASRLLTALLTVFTLGSLVVCLPFIVFSGIVTRILAPGMATSSVHLSAQLMPALMLVLPLTAVAETLRSALNARHWFVAPALMNGVMNVVAAAAVFLLWRHGIQVAAWAYLAGAAGRVVFALPLAHLTGYRFRLTNPVRAFRDKDVRDALRITSRPSASAGLAPTVRLVEQAFASFLPAGAISLLAYGYRLVWALAGTVFFRSVVGVIVPRVTEATVEDDLPGVRQIVGNAFRFMTVAAVGLIMLFGTLGVPICLVVFHRGNFTHRDAVILGGVIAVLGLSLIGEAWQRVLLVPFFSRLDTKTPFRNAIYGALAELVLLPVIVLPLRNGYGALYGIAAAFVISEYVGPVHAWYHLRRLFGHGVLGLNRTWKPVIAAALIAGVIGWGSRMFLDGHHDVGRLASAALLAAALAATTAVYVGIVAVLTPNGRQLLRLRKGGSAS
jgi:putative peptidoglycan lipid II flippase